MTRRMTRRPAAATHQHPQGGSPMELRLHGTPDEVDQATERLTEVFDVVSASTTGPTEAPAAWSASTSNSASPHHHSPTPCRRWPRPRSPSAATTYSAN